MANLEQTPVIQFRTDDSGVMKTVSSVKELKTAISQLKDSIVEMRQNGQDTTKEVNQLQAAQRELTTVMNLSKKGVDGVEGSYDRLVAQLREAKQEWRALPKFIDGELNPAWESARQKCEQLNTTLKEYDEGVGVFTRNVGNYKSALEGWTGTLGNVAQVGGQMNNGLAQMANLMGIVGADTSGLNNGMKALQITIGLINGARGLLGFIKNLGNASKAEKADTVITKTNTAAHTTNTVAKGAETTATLTLKGAIEALKASLTGGVSLIVGAVFTAISGLVTWLLGASDAADELDSSLNDDINTLDRFISKFDELKSENSHQIALMRARGATEEEIHRATIANLQKELDAERQKEQFANELLEKDRNILEAQKKNKEAAEATRKEMEQAVETRDAAIAKQKELNTEIRRQNELYEAQKEGNAKKDADNAAKKGADAAKKAAEAQQKAIEEADKAAKKLIADTVKAAETESGKLLTKSEQLTKEYEKTKAAWEAARDDTRATAEDVEKINSGLQALTSRYLSEKYLAEQEEHFSEIQRETAAIYANAKDYEESAKKVLGFTDEEITKAGTLNAKNAERLSIIKRELALIDEYLKTEGGFNDIPKEILRFKNVSPEDIRKEVGEPVATAIQEYFAKSAEFSEVWNDVYGGLLEGYEKAVKEALSKGMYGGAAQIYASFIENFYDELKNNFAVGDVVKYVYKNFENVFAEFKRNSPLPTDFNWIDVLFPQDDIDMLEIEAQKIRDLLEHGILPDDVYWNKQVELAKLEGDLLNMRLNRFSAFFEEIEKYTNVYGKTTANVLNNTADLWNNLLEVKQKNIDKQLEEGKISEAEHKKQTERNKSSFEGVKALQISTAIINTAAAIVQALADTTVPSYYVKAANAVAAGIAGAAEIAKIASTDYSSTVSAPQAPQITQAPQIVNSYGLNAQDYAAAAAANPVKVYVLESDITEAQNTSKVRVEESTF